MLKPSRSPSPRWLVAKPFAHMGIHSVADGCPQNTLLAFSKAIESGTPIELDVQVIADNSVVVFHDDELLEATGLAKRTDTVNLAEIKALSLYNTQETIPTLEELLRLVQGQVPLLIEIKNPNNRRGIERFILTALQNYQGDFAIQSFNPFTLAWFRKHAPEIPRGQLSGDFRDEKLNPLTKWLLKRMLFNWLSQPDFIVYDLRALSPEMANHLRATRPLLLWTVTNLTEQALANQLADNYITDLHK